MMPLVALALIVVQEMSARLGVVTGKGLADLIRESLGVRATAIILGILMFANLANTVSEFAGVAASMEIFGVSKYHLRAGGGRGRLAADRQGQLQVGRADLPGGQRHLPGLRRLRASWRSPHWAEVLAGRCHAQLPASKPAT